jgi:hypothetical protein
MARRYRSSRAEQVGVGQGVGGVAVDVERETRERGPDGVDHVEVPSGPELELDPGKSLVDGSLDPLHQDVQRVLDAEVGPDRHPIARAAEGRVQRHPLPPGLQHPPGDLQGGPCELIALHEGDPV